MNDPSHTMNRSFPMWQTPISVAPPEEHVSFANPNPNPRSLYPIPNHGRPHWKGKKPVDKRKPNNPSSNYRPPTLNELQHQNRVRARRFYSNNKKKFSRFAPFAPRNTTSFLIRAKKAGGIASLVSPCPVTPAVLPTPKFSPSREGLVDMAKEEWGVDGYGSMKGLIRLRSPTGHEDDDVEDGSSESDVEEHVEVERRLDHDLSRFEMVCRHSFGDEHGGPGSVAAALEYRVDDQDAQIAQLEEENLTLKERLFLMEREMGELKTRLQMLETGCGSREGDNNLNLHEETSDNEGGGDVCSEEKSAGD